MANKIITILMLVLLVTACATMTQTKTVSDPIECGVAPKWDAIVLERVTPQSIKNAAGEPGVHFSPEDYKMEAKNWQNVKKFIRQSNASKEWYDDCLEKHNARIERQNAAPPVPQEKSFTDKLKFWK